MRSQRLVFFSACLGMLLFGISIVTLGSVAPGIQARFNLNQIDSGAMFSILPFGILGGSLLFGPFADRYGYRIILLLSCLCMLIGFQGIAFATSFNLFRVCIFLFGLGGGAINGAANAVVSDISMENKSANLSLLGVFYAVGALGMPFVLGVLEKQLPYSLIVSLVGLIPLAGLALFVTVQFPLPKQKEGVPFSKGVTLMRDPFLLLIGFFLFCQSSFEGIINNWTTSYLVTKLGVPNSQALFALSSYVAGMAVMRIIIGSVLRDLSAARLLVLSFTLLLAGAILLQFAGSYWGSMTGLVLVGAGLAAGFPVMLGFVGNRYADLSGTAFSIVIVIAMFGNMVINYLMGIIAETSGIHHLTTLIFGLTAMMILLSLVILKKINSKR